MKMKTVYLLYGEIADYSDSDWWPVAWFTTEEKAELARRLYQANPKANDPYTERFSKYRLDDIEYKVSSYSC